MFASFGPYLVVDETSVLYHVSLIPYLMCIVQFPMPSMLKCTYLASVLVGQVQRIARELSTAIATALGQVAVVVA